MWNNLSIPFNDSESNIKFRSHLVEYLKNIKLCQKCFIFDNFNYTGQQKKFFFLHGL